MKILIVEDEVELLKSISTYLSSEGFLCEEAMDYNMALQLLSTYQYDCVIVDITLPMGSGLDLIKILKDKKEQTGIIIISAKNSIDDRIRGLELGSDDYLSKPFHLSELNARVKALMRRRSFDGNNIVSCCDNIFVDMLKKTVFVQKEEVFLTHKEYDLLLYFISAKNKVLTKEAIAEHLWGSSIDQADSFDFIYTHIKNLRKKLMDAGAADPIKTVYGMGYKLVSV
jgi:DNA-binding response OmpR family regulator